MRHATVGEVADNMRSFHEKYRGELENKLSISQAPIDTEGIKAIARLLRPLARAMRPAKRKLYGSPTIKPDKSHAVKPIKTYEKYYGSRWPEIREAVLTRDNYTCQNEACSSKETPEVHHIIPLNKFVKLANTKDNLITLCHECHRVGGRGNG